MAWLIHRVAIDEDVLAVQLNTVDPRGVDLIQITLEFCRNTARGQTRTHCRDSSRCGTLKRNMISGRGLHESPLFSNNVAPHARIKKPARRGRDGALGRYAAVHDSLFGES